MIGRVIDSVIFFSMLFQAFDSKRRDLAPAVCPTRQA
jgi:hypothetical protein